LLFSEIINSRVTLKTKTIKCKLDYDMAKVHMSICVLLLQKFEVWCPAMSLLLEENVADTFMSGGENAISEICRQDVLASSFNCQSFKGQITVTSVPFADSRWQNNKTSQHSCIYEV
jgi:hypothetical protein